MYCEVCGEILSVTANFCPSCGNKLPASDKAATPNYRNQGRGIDTTQTILKRPGLVVISIFCIIIIFLPMGSFGESFYDRATIDCIDCELRDAGLITALFLGLISLICFIAALNLNLILEIIDSILFLPEKKKERDTESFDIMCDSCGIKCTSQSWFVQETGEDFCDVCFKNKTVQTHGERQVNGITRK